MDQRHLSDAQGDPAAHVDRLARGAGSAQPVRDQHHRLPRPGLHDDPLGQPGRDDQPRDGTHLDAAHHPARRDALHRHGPRHHAGVLDGTSGPGLRRLHWCHGRGCRPAPRPVRHGIQPGRDQRGAGLLVPEPVGHDARIGRVHQPRLRRAGQHADRRVQPVVRLRQPDEPSKLLRLRGDQPQRQQLQQHDVPLPEPGCRGPADAGQHPGPGRVHLRQERPLPGRLLGPGLHLRQPAEPARPLPGRPGLQPLLGHLFRPDPAEPRCPDGGRRRDRGAEYRGAQRRRRHAHPGQPERELRDQSPHAGAWRTGARHPALAPGQLLLRRRQPAGLDLGRHLLRVSPAHRDDRQHRTVSLHDAVLRPLLRPDGRAGFGTGPPGFQWHQGILPNVVGTNGVYSAPFNYSWKMPTFGSPAAAISSAQRGREHA